MNKGHQWPATKTRWKFPDTGNNHSVPRQFECSIITIEPGPTYKVWFAGSFPAPERIDRLSELYQFEMVPHVHGQIRVLTYLDGDNDLTKRGWNFRTDQGQKWETWFFPMIPFHSVLYDIGTFGLVQGASNIELGPPECYRPECAPVYWRDYPRATAWELLSTSPLEEHAVEVQREMLRRNQKAGRMHGTPDRPLADPSESC